jgi:hypothetical protein
MQDITPEKYACRDISPGCKKVFRLEDGRIAVRGPVIRDGSPESGLAALIFGDVEAIVEVDPEMIADAMLRRSLRLIQK